MPYANDTRLVWRNTAAFWVLIGIILVLVGFSFHETILDMEHRWAGSEEYGYGYLIPVITLFLIWQRKNQLAEIEVQPLVFRSSAYTLWRRSVFPRRRSHD